MDQKLKDILEEEKEAHRQECRKTYVSFVDKFNMKPNIEEAALIVGSLPAKKFVHLAKEALNKHQAVLIFGKGQFLEKAIAIAEQVKQDCSKDVVQFTNASLLCSLINPEYKPSASLKNVKVFFSDPDDGTGREDGETDPNEEQDAIRAIRGPKVYDVPLICIALVKNPSRDRTYDNWTRQSF